MEYRYIHNDTEYTIVLEQLSDGSFQAQIDGITYDVQFQHRSGGALAMHIDGQPLTAYVASKADTRYTALHHNTVLHYNFERVKFGTTRRVRGATASGQIIAQMPGQVIELQVAVGDVVQQGQTLLVLEAMKMEIRVQAPFKGTVTDVFVNLGHSVDRGAELLKLDADKD